MRHYYRLPIVVPLIALVLALIVPLFAVAEEIQSYSSDIEIEASGDLLITEKITVLAKGNNIKHGIYRDFPTRYRDRYGNTVKLDFDLLKTTRDGMPESYHTNFLINGIRIYLGKASYLLPPGIHTYELKFRTTRQIGFFKDHDELYFNVIGTGWKFPIMRSNARVYLPSPVSSDRVHLEAYTGRFGEKGSDYSAWKQNRVSEFWTTRPLQPGEGFTIVVSWPKGLVRAPTLAERIWFLLSDNSALLAGLFGLAATIGYFYLSWLRAGKDPEKGTIIPRFEAPENIPAYGVRYIDRMGFDKKCLAAALTSLATKKHIRFIEEPRLIGRPRIALETLAGNTETLDEVETSIKSILLPLGISRLQLDNQVHHRVQGALASLESNLKRNFLNKLFFNNNRQVLIGFLISVATVVCMAVLAFLHDFGGFGVFHFLIIGILIAQIFAFRRWLKAPTELGRKIMDQIEGYKMFLGTAEGDTLKGFKLPDINEEVFEKHLPFAVALDLEDQWSNRLNQALHAIGKTPDSYHPIWYSGDSFGSGDSTFLSVSSSLSSAIASSATPPGSSSGSGGGGSSGGGGGGGGGGGW